MKKRDKKAENICLVCLKIMIPDNFLEIKRKKITYYFLFRIY